MKTRYKILSAGIIMAIIGFISISGASYLYQAESEIVVVCNEKFFPRHIYYCQYPDGHLKGFNTYEQMNAYYVPPLEETYVPETIYIYSGATSTLSGK